MRDTRRQTATGKVLWHTDSRPYGGAWVDPTIALTRHPEDPVAEVNARYRPVASG